MPFFSIKIEYYLWNDKAVIDCWYHISYANLTWNGSPNTTACVSLRVLINEINDAYWIMRQFSVYEVTRIAILWPTSGLQRGNLRPLVTTVHCGWRPQHSWSHWEAIHGQRISQFIGAKRYNSWEVTVAKIDGSPTLQLEWGIWKGF